MSFRLQPQNALESADFCPFCSSGTYLPFDFPQSTNMDVHVAAVILKRVANCIVSSMLKTISHDHRGCPRGRAGQRFDFILSVHRQCSFRKAILFSFRCEPLTPARLFFSPTTPSSREDSLRQCYLKVMDLTLQRVLTLK